MQWELQMTGCLPYQWFHFLFSFNGHVHHLYENPFPDFAGMNVASWIGVARAGSVRSDQRYRNLERFSVAI